MKKFFLSTRKLDNQGWRTTQPLPPPTFRANCGCPYKVIYVRNAFLFCLFVCVLLFTLTHLLMYII